MASKYALEAVFNLIDKVTRPLDKIQGKSKSVTKALKHDFTAAQKKVDALGKSFAKWGKRAALASAAAAGAFAGKGVKDAAEFQTALAKVKTIADTTKVSMNQFSKGILNLSSKTGVAAIEIGESVYAAISAGVDTSRAVSFTEAATKAAIGGFTDAATAIDGLTSILNAYGLSADKAMGIADKMLLTQNLGKTSFGAMAQSIKQVIPTAAALNVKTDELFASVASLTGTAGYDTAKAMTGLNRALIGIMKPEGQAAEMAKKLGLNFSAAGLQSRGFAQTIRDIYRVTGGNQDIIGQLFGSAEALKVVNVLGRSGSALFEKTLDEMQNAAGATQRAFETMMDTPEKRWAIALNKMKNAGINLGTALLPVAEKIIEKISGIAVRLNDIDFSQYTAQIDGVFKKIEGLASGFINLIEFAWQFRDVIMAVVIPLSAYQGVLMTIAIVSGPVKAAIFALTLTMGEQTAALALLKGGTLKYLVVDKLFTTATAIRNGVLNLLTGGTLAQTAATASMAVATGTATKGQWLLNAAMTANPIGVVILAVITLIGLVYALVKLGDKATALFITLATILTGPVGLAIGFIVSMIVEVVKNVDQIKKAFTDGGFIAGIKRIGGVLLSGLLAPVQGLLEILSHIPGLGHLAGKGAQKIEEIRNSLKGIDKAAEVVDAVVPEEVQTTIELPAMDDYQRQLDALNMPSFGMPDASKLHGVVDISNGPSAITHYFSAVSSAVSSPVPAIAAPPIPAPVITPLPPQAETLTITKSALDVLRHIDAALGGPILTAITRPPLTQVPPVPPSPVPARTPQAPPVFNRFTLMAPAVTAPATSPVPAIAAPPIPAPVVTPLPSPQTETLTLTKSALDVLRHIDAALGGPVLAAITRPPLTQVPPVPPSPVPARIPQAPPVFNRFTLPAPAVTAPVTSPVPTIAAPPIPAPAATPLPPPQTETLTLTKSGLDVLRHIDTTLGTEILTAITRPPPIQTPPTTRYINPGTRERESADRDNPRNIAPVSREERMAYSLQERREILEVQVSAAKGTEAQVVRRPRPPNIELATSGGNR